MANNNLSGMPKAPEIELADSLITWLSQTPGLCDSVIQTPCQLEEQTAGIQIATSATGLAIVVIPEWPIVAMSEINTNQLLHANGPKQTNTGGIVRARLQVAVISTKNLLGMNSMETIHSAIGFCIAAIMRWEHDVSRGIPYADPRIDEITDLDLKKLPNMQNAIGASILVSKPVSFKHYYANV